MCCFFGLERLVCDTLPQHTISNLDGLDFVVETADCAFLGSNWETTVLISEAGRQRKVPVFGYYPEFLPYQGLPIVPEFRISDEGAIIIGVDKISSIIMQASEWNGRPIHYQIGRIEYANPNTPERNDLPCRRVRRPGFAPASPPNPKLDPWQEWSLDCRAPEVR